jgi:hypothetical protein
MEYVQEKLGTPIITHAKYYSSDNEYQKQFPFLIETDAAIPLTVDYWDFIMNQAKSWGGTHLLLILFIIFSLTNLFFLR